MSTTQYTDQIDYPESDGRPMGETDIHRDWTIRLLDILRLRYRGQRVYVASDLLIYYQPGQPTKFIVPDNFVVLDCDPGRRRIFKTWEENRVPDVVFEITSRSSEADDLITKPGIYEQIGVKEYFLYDPVGSYLEPPLQGYRLQDDVYVEITQQNGRLRCETLGISFQLNGDDLEIFDLKTGDLLLTEAESERQGRENERQARESAEANIRQLQTELDQLRNRLKES